MLSILMPGLGHLYAGRPRLALVFLLASLVAGVLLVAGVAAVVTLSILRGPLFLLAVIVVGLLIPGSIAWSAARTARAAETSFVLRPYNRWYVYAGALLFTAFVLQPLYVSLLNKTLLQAYKIPSTSMEPTLLQGDFVFATPLHRAPARGEIVVYRRHGLAFVKRVVGLPSDTLSMENGALFVNRHAVAEPYASHRAERSIFDEEFSWQRGYVVSGVNSATYHPTLTFWGPLVVPPGGYFVLGDNRGESADSRYTGFVSADSVTQRPVVVYLSLDSQIYHIRWSRIGAVVK